MRFIIGDVKGQGIDVVDWSVAVLAAFRAVAFGEPDLIRLAEAMDTRLSREMELEDFVTVIVAEFTPGMWASSTAVTLPPSSWPPMAGACSS